MDGYDRIMQVQSTEGKEGTGYLAEQENNSDFGEETDEQIPISPEEEKSKQKTLSSSINSKDMYMGARENSNSRFLESCPREKEYKDAMHRLINKQNHNSSSD